MAGLTWRVDVDNGLKVVRSGRRGGWSCDQVCQAKGEKCVQSALAALKGNDTKVKAAYASAGMNCKRGIRHDCEAGNNCVRWGAPYIHNSHIEDPLCWGGSKPDVAPCGQRPVDGQHRRLCPCSATSHPSAAIAGSRIPVVRSAAHNLEKDAYTDVCHSQFREGCLHRCLPPTV